MHEALSKTVDPLAIADVTVKKNKIRWLKLATN